MATSGFSFGTGSNPTTQFGAKSTASAFNFGTTSAPKTGGFSFGSTAPNTTNQANGLFGAKTFGLASSSSASTSAPTLFGTTTSNAFGATITQPTFGFTASSANTTAIKPFGLTSTSSSGLPFGKMSATSSTAGNALTLTSKTSNKALENPKEAEVPKELCALVTDLEAHIKKQKEIKDDISKISSQDLSKIQDNTTQLKQSVSLIAHSLQKDSLVVSNLKDQVSQELKNAELANRVKDISMFGSYQEFTAPMEYFQQLVFHFESRVSNYRAEIEELELFLSSTSSTTGITPQNLLLVMKQLNESFIELASDLHEVHENLKNIKQKYLQFRRIVYNDSTDPFLTRKRSTTHSRKARETAGPSPFPLLQGASIFYNTQKDLKGLSNPSFGTSAFGSFTGGFGSTFGKSSGLTRSLSVGGKSSSGFGGQSGGSGLFGKPSNTTLGLNLATTTTATTPFTLQKPPSGKRGKVFF